MSLPQPHPSLVTAFEQASNDVQVSSTRAAAEQTLSTLTTHPDSISLMFAVLQSTSSSVARFHAAKALYTVTRDRWHTISPHHRYSPSSFRHTLINIVIANPQLQAFERVAILRTVAFLTRRAYLEEPPRSRDTFFAQLCQTASSPQSPDNASLTTIQLIDLIIDEFNAGFGSSPNSPAIDREMFMRSRRVFSSPQGHLLSLFQASISLLQYLTSSIPPQSYVTHPFYSKALPALSIIYRILTTDFCNDPAPTTPENPSEYDFSTDITTSDSLETVVIKTFAKPEWQPLISQISLLLTLSFSILRALTVSAADNADPDTDFLSNPLNIITAISAISFSSYPSSQSASETLSTILNGVNEQRWSVSPHGPVRLAYAEVWRRISCAHGFANIQRLPSNYIVIFRNDTCQQMNAMIRKQNSTEDPIEEDFSMDVVDLLLETWANLALQGDDGSNRTPHPLSSNIEQVTLHFMRMSLRTTDDNANAALTGAAQPLPDVEEDLGFEDSSIDDARLVVAAILTRCVLDKMADALAQTLIQAADKVFNWPRGQSSLNGLPLDTYQEDLFFLIRLTGAVLSDEGKGEYPSVPIQFIPVQNSVANGHAKSHMYAHRLLSSIFKVAEMESRMLVERGVHCDEASPRIASALLDGLVRIVRTYLAPLNTENVALTFEIAGGQQGVEQGRHCCFVKTMEGLTQRGFEGDISEAAGDLLSCLATASKTYKELIEFNTWQHILQAGVESFQTLAPKAVQDVGKSLTTVLGDVIAEQLLIPAYGCLQTFSASQEQVANAAERAIATLNLIRGASRCDILGERTRRTLTICLQAPDGVVASCAKSFGRTRPDVSRVVMLLVDDIIYNTLAHISESDGRELLNHVLTLLKLHANILKSHVGDLSLDDLAGDVEDMLTLLTHILDEDMNVDVGEACFCGLSTLLGLMNESVLDVPSVNRGFFRFVAQLVCTHADKLILLPPDFCARILQSIDMQRVSFDLNSERKALEAIASLARTRVLAMNANATSGQQQSVDKLGLELKERQGPIESAATSSDGQQQQQPISGSVIVDNALREFLIRIFEAIANGSAHTSNLDAAADALLPLAHVDVGTTNNNNNNHSNNPNNNNTNNLNNNNLNNNNNNNNINNEDVSPIAAFEQVAQALVTSSGNNTELGNAVVQLAHAATEAGAACGLSRPKHPNGSATPPPAVDRRAVLQATKRFREAVATFSNEARNCLVSAALAASNTSSS